MPAGTCAAVSLLVGFLLSPAGTVAAPNVVIVLADDLGFGDVAYLNPQSRIPTPNLDALANQGMAFTDAHTPSGVCTPTRYGLLTGRYAWRTRLKRGVLNGYGEPLLAAGRTTIGTYLQSAGYRTAIVGKWHLGLGFAKDPSGEFDFSAPVTDGPHTHGFDESFIIPASLDFPPYVYIRDGRITGSPLGQQPALKFPRFMRAGGLAPDLNPVGVLDELVRRASDFIRRQAAKNGPFFVYVPLTAPHKPVWPATRFVGKTGLGPYGDFVAHVDGAVGELLTAIDEAGARDDSLVIFTSDNGSFMYRLAGVSEPDHTDDPAIQAYRSTSHTANYVYRGTKADIWEAAHRVPFLVRWPGEVPEGRLQRDPICVTDVLATLVDIVGAELPEGAAEDSVSFLGPLRGMRRSKPRGPIIHHSSGGMFAIRDGRWKLVAGNGSGGRERPRGEPFGRPYQLFDLQSDPSERRNVFIEKPAVARRLEQALERIRASERSR